MPLGVVSQRFSQNRRLCPGAWPFDAGQVISVIHTGLRFCPCLRRKARVFLTILITLGR